jgi:hypothetical protein
VSERIRHLPMGVRPRSLWWAFALHVVGTFARSEDDGWAKPLAGVPGMGP